MDHEIDEHVQNEAWSLVHGQLSEIQKSLNDVMEFVREVAELNKHQPNRWQMTKLIDRARMMTGKTQ